MTKLESVSANMRERIRNYLNHNLALESFLENGFEGTLRSKADVLSISKEHFSVFCKFYSDEVETFSGKVRQSTENYLRKHW